MAKKRRKGEKEDTYEWVPPEFDEKAFLEKDIVITKAMMLTAGLAIVFGALAFLVGAAVSNILGFLVYVVGAYVVMKGLPKLRILQFAKKEDSDRNSMLGNIALYMLLSLGVWILLMNPPFSA